MQIFHQANCGYIQDLRQRGAGLPVHPGDGGAGEERVGRDGRRGRHQQGVRHDCRLHDDEQQRVSKQHPGKALLLRVHDVRNFTVFKSICLNCNGQ